MSLVITDLDGTLLGDNSILSESNKMAIIALKEAGHMVGIASGRGVGAIKRMMEKYGIIEYIDVIIGFNGAFLYISDEAMMIEEAYLEPGSIQRIVLDYQKYDVAFSVHEGEQLIASKPTPYVQIEQELNEYGIRYLDDFASEIKSHYPKLMVIGSKETLDEVEADMHNATYLKGFNVMRSHDYFLEVLQKGVSKGSALRDFCQRKHIQLSDVVSFGDQMNDYEMIEAAGHGVAMANAHPLLRAIANEIGPHHAEDGFAQVLREKKFIE